MELRIVLPDGSTRWLDVKKLVAFTDEAPGHSRPQGAILVSVDITERKRSELELRQSQDTVRNQLLEIESIYATAHVGLCVLDRDLRFVRINDRLAEINGLPAADHIGKTVRDVLPSLADEVERIAGRIIATGEGVADIEISGITPAQPGVERFWLEQWMPLKDSSGAVVAINVVVEEITDRKRAEVDLRRSQETYLGLIENAPFGVYLVDSDFRLAKVGAGAQNVFSKVRPLIGRDFAEVLRSIWSEPFASEAIARFRHTLDTGEPYHSPDTTERRGDVSETESYDWRIERVRLPDGKLGVVCYFYDLTEMKRSEERIKLLMQEVNHRSKNMLALVQSVARQTAAGNPTDFVARFGERIQALAASQDLLVRNEWKGVALRDLVVSQLAHFRDLVGVRISVRGPAVWITPPSAQTIGMAVHELATNAGKYGALSNDDGQIDISWDVDGSAENRTLTMEWNESGGPPVTPPSRRGFGSTVIGQVARVSLDAEVDLDYRPFGLVWRMRCPAGKVIEQRYARDEAPSGAALH